MFQLALDDLLKKLEEAFPNRIPQHKADIEEIRELQGQQRVIEYVRSLLEDE